MAGEDAPATKSEGAVPAGAGVYWCSAENSDSEVAVAAAVLAASIHSKSTASVAAAVWSDLFYTHYLQD